MPAKTKSSTQVAGLAQSCLHKQLRKTKFCMFHLQGACQFGKDCAFAHSLTEMSGMPDLRKTQLCKAFAEGKCEDPTCNFAHGEVELRSTDMFFKKSLCIWNEKGKCRNGSQCRFAHGLGELRSHFGQNIMENSQNPDINKESNKETSSPPESPASRNRRRKGKQNQNQQKPPGLELPNPSVQVRQISMASDSTSCGGSTTDTLSPQSAAEPMKVQPQSLSDNLLVPMLTEAQMLHQHQQLQHQWQDTAGKLEELQQWQDTLIHRLAALEGNELAFDGSCWQQNLNPMDTYYYNGELQNDFQENLGMEMGLSACKLWDESSDLLWQMQMEAGA